MSLIAAPNRRGLGGAGKESINSIWQGLYVDNAPTGGRFIQTAYDGSWGTDRAASPLPPMRKMCGGITLRVTASIRTTVRRVKKGLPVRVALRDEEAIHASLRQDRIPAQGGRGDRIVHGGPMRREWSASRPGHRVKRRIVAWKATGATRGSQDGGDGSSGGVAALPRGRSSRPGEGVPLVKAVSAKHSSRRRLAPQIRPRAGPASPRRCPATSNRPPGRKPPSRV